MLFGLPRETEQGLPEVRSILVPGELIFRPRHGVGTSSGLTRRDPLHPIQDVVTSEGVPDQAQDYYDIQLLEGGTLHVPVSRAPNVGLRRLTDGLEAVKARLCSPAESLPDDFRQRAAALRLREQLAEPSALAHSVRDMLAQSRGRTLTTSEKTWLDKSCERLNLEAALVDRISRAQARAAIWKTVNQLSAT